MGSAQQTLALWLLSTALSCLGRSPTPARRQRGEAAAQSPGCWCSTERRGTDRSKASAGGLRNLWLLQLRRGATQGAAGQRLHPAARPLPRLILAQAQSQVALMR